MNRRTSYSLSVAAVALSLCVAAVCGVTTVRTITAARLDAPGQTFTYYLQGNFITTGRDVLRGDEETASRTPETTWHKDPIFVAAVMSGNLLPAVKGNAEVKEAPITFNRRPGLARFTATWRAEYGILEQRGRTATVQVSIGGEPTYRITLERPFGSWWYPTHVTALTTIAP
jgi:hypothetical protein